MHSTVVRSAVERSMGFNRRASCAGSVLQPATEYCTDIVHDTDIIRSFIIFTIEDVNPWNSRISFSIALTEDDQQD